MKTKKTILNTGFLLAALYMPSMQAENPSCTMVQDNVTIYQSKRPDSRLFVSKAVDDEITRVSKTLKNAKLAMDVFKLPS